MNTRNAISQLFLRLALSLTMLSAIADRLGYCGQNSVWGNWENFEKYTRQLTFFLPESLSNICAYSATFLETLFATLLILGFKTKITAYGTACLLFLFGFSMTLALGIKSTFDYSVWIGCAASLLLAQQSYYFFSIDSLKQK